jgi:hypothetical protein
VDLLPSSSFLEGFGSHTRMLGGQGKDIRYHSNAAAALQLHKRLLLAEPHSGYDVTDEPLIIGPEDREALEEVNSVAGLWQVGRCGLWPESSGEPLLLLAAAPAGALAACWEPM